MDDGRDYLLNETDRRVLLFEVTGDSGPLLDPRSLADCAATLAAVNYSLDDIQVMTAAGLLHWHRHRLLSAPEDRTVAEAFLRPVHAENPDLVPEEIARAFPPRPLRSGDPKRLSDRSAELIADNERTGSLSSLDEAIRLCRAALASLPDGEPFRGVFLSMLVAALQLRYSQTGDSQALTEAVRLGLKAVVTTPDHFGDGKAGVLCVVGETIALWYERVRVPAVLDAAIGLHRRAASLAGTNLVVSGGDDVRGSVLSDLSNALATRSELTGQIGDLEEAISLMRRADGLRPADPVKLTNLGNKLQQWYKRTGDTSALDEASRVARQALDLTPPGHVYRNSRLYNLASVLMDRSRYSGPGELNEAISLLRMALEAAPEGHPDHGSRSSLLANALHARFGRARDSSDMREAVRLLRRLVAITPHGNKARGKYLFYLGQFLIAQADEAGAAADPDEVVRLAEDAWATTPAASDSDPVRAVRLSALGNAFRFRYERAGDPADLDRAVDLCEEAVQTIADHHDRDICLFNLASALRARFDRTGDGSALDRAIESFRESAELTTDDQRRKLTALALHGSALRARFDRAGQQDDLRAAVEAGRDAAHLAPDDVVILNNLANSLQAWTEATGDFAAAKEAAELGRRVVAAIPEAHPDRGLYLMNLANTLRDWSNGPGGETALAEAIGVGRQAVAATADGNPRSGTIQYNLAAALRTHGERTGNDGEILEAIAAYRAAAATETTPPLVRTEAAAAQGILAGQRADWESACDGLSHAVELLPTVAPRELNRSDQEHGLGRFAGVASQAAACALQLGRPERAAELLEHGRGILIAQALELRPADLSDLRAQDPELADRFEELRQQLSAVADGAAGAAGQAEALTRRLRELLTQRDATLARIRSLPGLADFARSPSVAGLAAQADAGPIVLVNTSQFRGDAVIVAADGVHAVALPGLTWEWVADALARLLFSLDQRAGNERRQARQLMLSVLADLWDTVTGPVLTELGITRAHADGDPWPRIWWSPAGLLSLLPLHAAGHHDETGNGNPRTALDRVVSSYIPTVRALEHARHRASGPAAPGEPLVIALSHTPGAIDLPGAGRESGVIRHRFPGTRVLPDDQATRARVLEAIPAHSIAHFACHATVAHQPSQSHLVLHDGPLSVLDISGRDLAGVRLAYLSACATARTDPALSDEAVHVTTAFQLAGYVHVVGTLWPIADEVAPEIADLFYRGIAGDAGAAPDTARAAQALHEALRRIRRRYPTAPEHWAAHFHTGP